MKPKPLLSLGIESVNGMVFVTLLRAIRRNHKLCLLSFILSIRLQPQQNFCNKYKRNVRRQSERTCLKISYHQSQKNYYKKISNKNYRLKKCFCFFFLLFLGLQLNQLIGLKVSNFQFLSVILLSGCILQNILCLIRN